MYHAMLPTMILAEGGILANECYFSTHRNPSSLSFFVASIVMATNIASAVWETSRYVYDKNKVTEQVQTVQQA